jgi:hypothetical protein
MNQKNIVVDPKCITIIGGELYESVKFYDSYWFGLSTAKNKQ